MSTYPALAPQVLRWARERASLDEQGLARKMNVKPERVAEWESTGFITRKQVKKLADVTLTPIAYLYFPEPEEDRLPISDFRTVGGLPPKAPSPSLLETVYDLKFRQEWAREEMISQEEEPIREVGSVSVSTPASEAARKLGEWLGIEPGGQSCASDPSSAFRLLRSAAEEAGVFVVSNGIVGNNTSQKLDPDEFRGFALHDEYAPFLFVNAADAKPAQVFTLVHELAHILTGNSGVSSSGESALDHGLERFCNQVAADFLLPTEMLDSESLRPLSSDDERLYARLAKRFHVSTHVIAIRLLHMGHVTKEDCRRSLKRRTSRKVSARSGGDFYKTQNSRVGVRYGRMVARALKEWRINHLEACDLTGLKMGAMDNFMARLEDES